MRKSFQGVHLPKWFGDFVLNHRFLVLSGVAVVTAFAVAVALRMPVQTSLVESFVDDPAELERYRAQSHKLGGDSDALMYLATHEGERLFTAEVMNAIRAAAEEIEALPEVTTVSCLPNVPWSRKPGRLSVRQISARTLARKKLASGDLDSLMEEFRIRPVWPRNPALQARTTKEQLRSDLTSNRLVSGLLLGDDQETQIMVIKVAEPDMEIPAQAAMLKNIENALVSRGPGKTGIHSAGLIASQTWMFGEIVRAGWLLSPLGLFIISTTVWTLFRQWAIVLITAVVGLIAVAWGIGAVALLYGKLTVMVVAAPLVILVISTSDVIHLVTAYKLELERGTPQDQALRTVVSEVGGACVLTSITTFVGFVSLVLVPAPSLSHFAVAAAVGVAGALLLAMTVVPITLAWLPPFDAAIRQPSWLDRWLNRGVDTCMWISLRHSRGVIVISGLILLASVYSAFQIHIDADFPRRFPQGHPLRDAVDFFDERVEGTSVVEVFMKIDPKVFLTTEGLTKLVGFEDRLRAMPNVTEVYSLAMLYRAADEIFNFGTENQMPADQASAANAIELFRRLDPEQVGLLMTPEMDLSRVSVRLKPTGYLAVRDVARQIEQVAKEALDGVAKPQSSGSYAIVGEIVSEIVSSQVQGMFICFAAVTIIMALGLGSLRIALFAQIPNLLPPIMVMGALALTRDPVDTDLLGIPIVALGIAVDDTIHFLHRFRMEIGKSGDAFRALRQTFPYTGKAILKTTIILCLGLLPFAMSQFLSVWMLGTYLVFTLACAVLADLLLLPAMINVWRIRWTSIRPQ